MQRAFYRFAAGLAGLLCLSVFPVLAPAQSIWLTPPREPTFSIEALKPSFKRASHRAWTTSVFFLSCRVPISEGSVMVAEIPFVHSSGFKSSSFFGGSGSSNFIGNPYLGLEVGKPDRSVSGEFGVRLPLGKNFGDHYGASSVGRNTDYDRYEAFSPDLWSITGMLNYRHKTPSGLVVRLRGGPVLSFEPGESAMIIFPYLGYMGYSAQVWHESRRVHVGGGVTGRMLFLDFYNGRGGGIGKVTTHQLGVFANFPAGRVQPGVHIRVPLDEDLIYDLNLVVGVNLGITLR
jgi:hypothetical protein